MNEWSFWSILAIAVAFGFVNFPESSETTRSVACITSCGSAGAAYVETKALGGSLASSTCTCATLAKP